MNDLRSSGFVGSDKMSAMFPTLRHLMGWMISAFCSRQDLILENLALRQQLLALHAKRPRQSPVGKTETVLGSFEKALARMEEAPHSGDPENRS
jgi:hypothetical protein